MEDAMFGRFFAVNVKPDHRQAFWDASIFEAQSVLSEQGDVFQFHILGDTEDPNRFYFYEIYRDEATADAIRDTEAYKTWFSTTQSMLDGEIERIAYMFSVFPSVKGFEAQKPGLLLW